MGIWIRSQDKRILIEATTILLRPYDKGDFMSEAKEEDISYLIISDSWELGNYPTEVEAMTVMDRLREVIGTPRVFEMPAAGFSKEAGTFSPGCGMRNLSNCGLLEDGSVTCPYGIDNFIACKSAHSKEE